jgi:hypothetical protein
MSEETPEDEQIEADEPDAGDPSLAHLVRLPNAGAMELGLTVSVGGATISGILMGVAQFHEGLAGWLEREVGAEGAALAEVSRQRADDIQKSLTGDFEKTLGLSTESRSST